MFCSVIWENTIRVPYWKIKYHHWSYNSLPVPTNIHHLLPWREASNDFSTQGIKEILVCLVKNYSEYLKEIALPLLLGPCLFNFPGNVSLWWHSSALATGQCMPSEMGSKPGVKSYRRKKGGGQSFFAIKFASFTFTDLVIFKTFWKTYINTELKKNN